MTILPKHRVLTILMACAVAHSAVATVPDRANDEAILGSLPMAFEENRGQSSAKVRFLSRGSAFDAFFTDEGATLTLGGSEARPPFAFDIRLVGGRHTTPQGLTALDGTTHYLIGDASRHVVDIRTFSRVRYESVYRGIDIVYYGNRGRLEYDLIVAPNADPRVIRMAFDGIRSIEVSGEGNLVLRTPSGAVELHKPIAYQDIEGARTYVDARYRLSRNRQVGFQLGRYDRDHTLVIDPVVTLATNVWGSATGVALDAARNIYIAGTTSTRDLPASVGYQTQLAGTQDAYVAKLNPAGTSVIWATYLGARRATTLGLGIAVDGAGSAYVTGTTTSTSFPITPGAYRTSGSTFVTKLTPAGSGLAYSTYVPAPVSSLAVDSAGHVFLTGTAGLLTTTPGAFQPTKVGLTAPYVAKLNPQGTALPYATYLGGSANDDAKGIAVDASGHVYVVGVARSSDFPIRNPLSAARSGPTDAFVAKLNPTGTALVYSTYLGGSAEERGLAVAANAAGQAFVTGWTSSTNFPTTPGVFQPSIGYPDPSIRNAFVAKLDSSGNRLVYSSYLGGRWCLTATVHSCFGFFGPDEGIDVGTSIAVDAAGFAYVGGYATSTEFPLVDSPQTVSPDGDGWHVPLAARVAPAGDRLVYAAVLGGKVQDGLVRHIAIDGSGGAVLVGDTPGALFPLSAGAVLGSGNAFVFKLGTGVYPTTVESSANPAARGDLVTLKAFVANPSPAGTVTFQNGSIALGTASAVEGTATLTVSLAPGVHRITATNSADGQVSPPLFQIVRGQ